MEDVLLCGIMQKEQLKQQPVLTREKFLDKQEMGLSEWHFLNSEREIAFMHVFLNFEMVLH